MLPSVSLRNEREFKLKVYPSLGLSFVLPYVFWFTELQSSTWADFRQSSFVYTFYIVLMLVVTVVVMLKFSGQYKAFWTFRAAPMANDSALYKGALKAFLCNMFLPVFLANAVLFTWTFGSRILPDIAIILLTATALVPLAGKLLLLKPPFSQSFSVAQQSDGWYVLAALPVLAMLWGVHVFFRSVSGGIWIYGAILIVANVFLWTLLYREKKAPEKRSVAV